MPVCSITKSQQDASDKSARQALERARASGSESTLAAIAARSAAVMTAGRRGAVAEVPAILTKKHDVIRWFRQQGLSGQAVVDAMTTHGFKIKLADVNANAKWYGSGKIPAHPFFSAPQTASVPGVVPTRPSVTKFKEGAAARKVLRKQQPELSAIERDAIRTYQGGPYKIINEAARDFDGDVHKWARQPGQNNFYDTEKAFIGKVQRQFNALDRALGHAPTIDEGVVAYRAVSTPHRLFTSSVQARKFGHREALAADSAALSKLESMVGGTLSDDGFISTTIARGQAERWGRKQSTDNRYVLFKIKVPAHKQALWMENVSDQSHFVVQQELLFNRGQRFKIVKVTGRRNSRGELDGPIEIEVEML